MVYLEHVSLAFKLAMARQSFEFGSGEAVLGFQKTSDWTWPYLVMYERMAKVPLMNLV